MNEFMFLFRGGDARMATLSAEESQAHMAKWGAWMQSLGQEGKLVSGLPFQLEGRVVTNNGETVSDSPYEANGEKVGGYLHVKAASLDEAVGISKQCPIFEHGGSVEVRQMASM